MSRRRHALLPTLEPGPRARGGAPRSPQEGVRAAAARVLERTLASRAPVDGFFAAVEAPFEARDRGLLRELVLGTLRWLRRIDAVIAGASHRPFEDIEPGLRAPLRIAVYQLLFLDRVPAHAAVHEAVELALRATHRGGASFANAVLRRVARRPRLEDWPVREPDPIERLAVEWSHPTFLVRRWIERFGREATEALLEADNRPRAAQVLAFRDRGGRELLAETLIDEGLEVEATTWSALGLRVVAGDPTATAAFRRGDLYVQNEASQAAALLPPPRPGERVLDLAAAPGGKSFALLAAQPLARATAADLDVARLATMRRNCVRLGRRIPLFAADGALLPLRGAFDRVVVDLPCSGTGTLRKHPEIKWRLSEAEIERLAEGGLRLLRGAAPAVRPGGLLSVVTCSLEREENEDVVERFLGEQPRFSRLDLLPALDPVLARQVAGAGLWRLLTGGEHDGFTVQVLRRAPAD